MCQARAGRARRGASESASRRNTRPSLARPFLSRRDAFICCDVALEGSWKMTLRQFFESKVMASGEALLVKETLCVASVCSVLGFGVALSRKFLGASFVFFLWQLRKRR